jgi:hypothetical protein
MLLFCQKNGRYKISGKDKKELHDDPATLKITVVRCNNPHSAYPSNTIERFNVTQSIGHMSIV